MYTFLPILEKVTLRDGYLEVSSSVEHKPYKLHLMQFTGLTDAKGRQIYEGDVVRCRAYQREQTVLGEYEPEQVVVEYRDGYFYPFGYNAGWRSGVHEIEVIGNIYENPELISRDV